MRNAKMSTPVSRGLVKIIRDACRDIAAKSQQQGGDDSGRQTGKTLGDDLSYIQERQNKEIEFYLRTCSSRLSRAS